MIRHLVASTFAAFAGTAHAQQWVERSDALAFDRPPPIWCNAERTACAVSRQPYGATGALRVALTVVGTPDCKYRRPRYGIVRRSGEKEGDLSRVNQIEGTRFLQFSVPMLTHTSVVIELSLDGLDVDRLPANRP